MGMNANQGTASGAIVKIVVDSDGVLITFGLTDGTDTTIQSGGLGYTFGQVNLGAGFTFSDAGLTSTSNIGGSGGSIRVVISPKDGHGANAVDQLGGHYVMLNTLFIGAERDDLLTGNDFRNIAIAVDPTNFGTSTVATDATIRQTYALKLAIVDLVELSLPMKRLHKPQQDRLVKLLSDPSLNILYYQQERYKGLRHTPSIQWWINCVQVQMLSLVQTHLRQEHQMLTLRQCSDTL